MRQSKNAIIKHCFPSTEPDSKKRPETVRNDSDNDDAYPLIYKTTINKPSTLVYLPFSPGGDSV